MSFRQFVDPSPSDPGLRVLWVATKSPFPPQDGGRLLLWETLGALAASGVELTLVAPAPEEGASEARDALQGRCEPRLVEARLGSRVGAAFRTLWGPEPWTLVRHRWPALRAEVEDLVSRRPFHLAVAEQLQAAQAAAPARDRGIPLLLRAQNVESSLWRQCVHHVRGIPPVFLAREAQRVEAFEREAVRMAAWVVALSVEDAAELALLAEGARHISVLPPPFPAELPPGSKVPGNPPCVFFGSAGWLPNRQAEEELERNMWPEIQKRCPEAVLYQFGGAAERAKPGSKSFHQDPSNQESWLSCSTQENGKQLSTETERFTSPLGQGRSAGGRLADSRWAFPENGILLLPLVVASGVRMRILEGWARGVPVVATPQAARGLQAQDGEELLLARSPQEFADAVYRLHREPGLREHLRKQGQAALQRRHDPKAVACAWLKLLQAVGRPQP